MNRPSGKPGSPAAVAAGKELADREVDLLAAIAAGDREAFSALYRCFYPRLSRYLRRFLRQPAAIEDAIHEIMLVVWRRANTFRGEAKVSTWILGIAYRKALEHLRRESSRPFVVPPERLASLEEPQQPAASEGESAMRLAVHEALGRLSAKQRAVVELTYFQGLSYREIARRLGCPENTVKTRMFHARRKLRRILGIPERSAEE